MVSAIVGVLWAMFVAPLMMLFCKLRMTPVNYGAAAVACWLGWMVPEVIRWWRA